MYNLLREKTENKNNIIIELNKTISHIEYTSTTEKNNYINEKKLLISENKQCFI